MTQISTCPCNGSNAYSQCCEPVIDNDLAKTAEQLMRSRYTAYTQQNYSYVLATYAKAQRAELSEPELKASAEGTQWLALQILKAKETTVQFVAYFAVEGQLQCLQETSSFIVEDGHWRYTSGVIEHTGKVQLSRNDTCFCGSGKKFKRCCQLAYQL